MATRGMKGRGTGLGDDNSRRYMPQVLFQPQEPGARNRANAKPVEPTRWYSETDAPVFRPFGANDEGGR